MRRWMQRRRPRSGDITVAVVGQGVAHRDAAEAGVVVATPREREGPADANLVPPRWRLRARRELWVAISSVLARSCYLKGFH